MRSCLHTPLPWCAHIHAFTCTRSRRTVPASKSRATTSSRVSSNLELVYSTQNCGFPPPCFLAENKDSSSSQKNCGTRSPDTILGTSNPECSLAIARTFHCVVSHAVKHDLCCHCKDVGGCHHHRSQTRTRLGLPHLCNHRAI